MFRYLVTFTSSMMLALAGSTQSDTTQCRWRGSAPICAGSCAAGEFLVSTDNRGDGLTCLVGQKALCCPVGQCTWRGRPPFCFAACESGERLEFYDQAGPTGSEGCLTGKKSLCCTRKASADG